MPTVTPTRQRAIADAIRQARDERDLSQEELADRAKLNRKTVGAIERGEWSPTFVALASIADGLSIALSELIRVYEERLGEQ